jgi:hypothetical protein
MLQKMKEASQPLTTSTIQPIFCGMIKSLTLDVICDTKLNGFKVTRKRTHQFVKHYMNWTLKVSTTCTSKLLVDWQEKGKFIAYHVAYLVKAYGIPP